MASTDEEDHFDDTDDNDSNEGHTRSLSFRNSNNASGIRSQNVFVSGSIPASKPDVFYVTHFLCLVVLMFTLFLSCFSYVTKVKWGPWDSENELGIKSSLCFVEFAVASPSRKKSAWTLRK